ncbi:MAG: MarR family transcriptional regulator [Burkholderiaceae bacterium]|nr:MarR family transcriptional regulator [Burkholderiaceae bacterium]
MGFLLRRAYQRATANLGRGIGAHDLTPPQFAVLARLHERGSVSQNLLGRLVVMEPANVRTIVQRLGRRGLVRTERAPADRRLLMVSLTGKGATLTRRLVPIELDATAATLAPLTPRERTQLRRLLAKVAQG